MKVCYIDEAGDTGQLRSATDSTQPVFVIGGLIVDYSHLHSLTHDYIALKQQLFPNLPPHPRRKLDRILPEIKGSELRKHVALGSRRKRTHAIKYLDEFIRLMRRYNVKIIGRIWIKGVGQPFDGKAVYTSSVQSLYTYCQHFLESTNDFGLIILDSRSKAKNVNVSHSLFTQKFRPLGDAYDRIYELPSFSHSENHAGLQLSDTLYSSLIFPISSFVYCTGFVNNKHVQPGFVMLKNRYASDLRQLQYRYQDGTGGYRGGLVVSDAINRRSGAELFR